MSPVYPRWRGEHYDITSTSEPSTGLSPLARGTHRDPHRLFHAPRFIPAGAGNTINRLGLNNQDAVYPRWRGEHSAINFSPLGHGGLSPLARGTPFHKLKIAFCIRFIPAGAGNTLSYSAHYRATPVYPRWRGEHSTNRSTRSKNAGLSPLARGTPFSTDTQPHPDRFIPAGAGNTI